MRKVQILRVSGGKSTEINLPAQFSEPVREDLIRRAVSSLRMSRRQPYGADPIAGKRQGYHTPKRRKRFKTTYGKGISRIRRKHLWARGGQFYWIGAFVASATGGRKAFAPRSGKVLIEKINRKERRKAIRSAMAASNIVVMDDKLESVKKTSEMFNAFKSNKMISSLSDDIKLLRPSDKILSFIFRNILLSFLFVGLYFFFKLNGLRSTSTSM